MCLVNGETTSRFLTSTSKQFLLVPGEKNKENGHHARPRRASATAPLRTGADKCKTGSGAGKRSGAKSDPVRRRSNHAWTEDQAGRRKRANIAAVGGWRVHTADDTPSRNAATRSKHCNFMCVTRRKQNQPGITPNDSTTHGGSAALTKPTSCAKGTYGPGQLQGRAGTGQHKPKQQQRGYDWSETPLATPPPRGPTQNTLGRGHPGEGYVLQSLPVGGTPSRGRCRCFGALVEQRTQPHRCSVAIAKGALTFTWQTASPSPSNAWDAKVHVKSDETA